MISNRIAGAVLALLTLGAAHAQTAPSGLTRDQVRAELADARRNGDVAAPGELGRTLREITPDRYPAPPATAAGLTRAQVVEELQEAHRHGEASVGESGRTAFDITPGNFPARAVAQGKTREQVRAELAEAVRTGDVVAVGEIGEKLNELHPQRYARMAGSPAHSASEAMASAGVR